MKRGFLAATVVCAVLSAQAAVSPPAPDPNAKMLLLTPSDLGGYALVREPTREKVLRAKDAGKKPFVATHELFDEKPALTNYGDCASAVAFDLMPRAHLVHSWKSLDVKLLQTVPFDPEGSADAFRRACGFSAFAARADGVWIPRDVKDLPPSWQAALDEAREDWRILLYLKQLADLAGAHSNGLVRTENRRVAYWFGWMPADWDALDNLRLESVGYARRLEQLLDLPPADLPTTRSKPIAPQTLPFKPYGDWTEKPVQFKLANPFGGRAAVDVGGGFSFSADGNGFSLTWSTTNNAIKGWTSPGKCLDFRVYVSGEKPGEWLPYHFHCDLDPQWYGPRSPAVCRSGFLFGIDERFRYGSIAYGVGYSRVSSFPKVREWGLEQPDPRPGGGNWRGNPKGGGSVTVSCSWASFLGHWPMLRNGKFDVWYVGLDRSPETGRPIAARILWPRGNAEYHMKYASRFSTGTLTDVYGGQLGRTSGVYGIADAEAKYGYAPIGKPVFHRYDQGTDHVFERDVVQPLLDRNENARQLFWTDKEHKHPKFNRQPDNVKNAILRDVGRFFHMSWFVRDRRAKYLEDRWQGKLPPEYKPKAAEKATPDEPDADFDGADIQLDEKEY